VSLPFCLREQLTIAEEVATYFREPSIVFAFRGGTRPLEHSVAFDWENGYL
jgi:hypothetical protein